MTNSSAIKTASRKGSRPVVLWPETSTATKWTSGTGAWTRDDGIVSPEIKGLFWSWTSRRRVTFKNLPDLGSHISFLLIPKELQHHFSKWVGVCKGATLFKNSIKLLELRVVRLPSVVWQLFQDRKEGETIEKRGGSRGEECNWFQGLIYFGNTKGLLQRLYCLAKALITLRRDKEKRRWKNLVTQTQKLDS